MADQAPEKGVAPIVRVGLCHQCGRPRLRNAAPCFACGAAFMPAISDALGEPPEAKVPHPSQSSTRRVVLHRTAGVVAFVLVVEAAPAFLAYQAGRADLLATFAGPDR